MYLKDRPIRMRGYYRAVKRGESWATKIEALKDKSPLSYLMALTYRSVDFEAILLRANPFIEMLAKEEKGYWGEGFILPVKLEEDK